MPAGDMDSEYSVGINNRFIGISSDMMEDPSELIRAAQEKPVKKDKDVKGKAKKDAKVKAKETKPDVLSPQENNEKGKSDFSDKRGGGRGRGRGGDRGGRSRGGFNRNNDQNGEGRKVGDAQGTKGACRRCGEEGHFAKECTQAPTGGNRRAQACHKCGEEGHFARECSNTESVPRSVVCHKCNEEGHFARQCPKASAANSLTCRKCSEVGHFARDCPQNETSNDTSTGYGGGDGGFGVPPLSEGFGVPSSGGGFGTPSDESESQGGRSGFRGGRGGRGGRRGGGAGGRGREFDRRSGSSKSSSVKATEKRDGSGSYNWGTPGEENIGEDTAREGEEFNEGETQEHGTESGEENKENAPEMSYEDYKKMQEEIRSKPQFNLRKANEGAKVKGKQLKKPSEEENEVDGSLFFPKKYYEERLKTSGRVKEHMNLEFQFTSGENRHLEDRTRRGGGKGRGRGGNRSGGKRDDGNANIQLENADEFPSLA